MNRLLDYLEPPEEDLVERLVANVNRTLDRQFGNSGRPSGRGGEFDYDPAQDDTKVEFTPDQPASSSDTKPPVQQTQNTPPPPPPSNRPSSKEGDQLRSPQDFVIPPPDHNAKPKERQVEVHTRSAKTAISVKGATKVEVTAKQSMAEWRSESKSVSVKILLWLIVFMLIGAGGFFWYVFLRN